MKFSSCIALLLVSFYLVAFSIGSKEANRLRHMMKSQAFSSSKVNNAKYVHDNVYVNAAQRGMMELDRIQALPGQPKGVDFDQFSGYVTVDPKAGRALFYYFVEAPQNASSKPLVLWLSGGPGCSSLGGGAMLELGPFFVNRDGKTLYRNEYSWNYEANMMFLESAAGTGFSYSNRSSDYGQYGGDNRTTADSYTFLLNWLERFPMYKGRDFCITGESYAGHFIPELATMTVASNKGSKSNLINLKGIAIGNAFMDADTSVRAAYDYLYTHALISPNTHKEIGRQCSFVEGSYTNSCMNAMVLADEEFGDIDRYNIYAPVCPDSSDSSTSDAFVNHGDDPCAGDYVETYLNLPEVQRALHANTTGLEHPWAQCRNLMGGGEESRSVLPMLKKLIDDGGLRVWLYSGDLDSIVPVTATQYYLDVLNLPIQTPWRPWKANQQVGGYVMGYKGLTFATVRGAGHMVPLCQPQRSLVLFKSFLDGQLPPP